ncbi:MAG: hypothetical protein ACK5WR_19855 [Planctomycetaceae bacterium]|jgi:hypothetical protein
MFFVRCMFCHKLVFRPLYERHKRKHTTPLADGQMTDHISLHPKGRFQGSLDDVPQVYRHSRCGGRTGMPEEIVRSYLVNPFLYSDNSFCCTCNDYVPTQELFWVKTGQMLLEYFENLRREYLWEHGEPPPNPKI